MTGTGTVLKTHGEYIIEGGQELIDESRKVNDALKANPPKELRL
jgi:hypothetical protein